MSCFLLILRRTIESETVYRKVTKCSSLLLFALVYNDLNCAHVTFRKWYKGLLLIIDTVCVSLNYVPVGWALNANN